MSNFDDPTKLCKDIINTDKKVRFAAIANNLAKIVASEYKPGLNPLLTKEESELSVVQSVIRMGTRKTLEAKIGKTIYAFAMYEKIKRATIPVGDFIVMVSFEIDCNHEPIILDRIIPLIKKATKS